MGKFAAIYDLPAGEQLLIMVVEDQLGGGPVIQYVTEINGVMATAEVALCEDHAKPDHLGRMAIREEARNSIQGLPEDVIKSLRRKFVRDITGKDEETYGVEDIACQPN
jgi:ABC-type microcin C transport system permease subunit YejB